MNSYEKYYTENLYPFQDGVLNIVKKSGTPFYLTGGTALSRGYFRHRYSDDLDLFVNQDDGYSSYVQTLLADFEAAQASQKFSINYNKLRRFENFTQFFLKKTVAQTRVELKIDIVNDVAPHYGGFQQNSTLGTLDSWQNILSNKLSAVFRYEAKDIVDLWVIARHQDFHWMEVIQEAKTKEAGVDPIVLFEILHSFPPDELSTIKWVTPVVQESFMQELHQIADDILQGTHNSLPKRMH
jgi:hypothetical protein